jgi:hypothetical protein
VLSGCLALTFRFDRGCFRKLCARASGFHKVGTISFALLRSALARPGGGCAPARSLLGPYRKQHFLRLKSQVREAISLTALRSLTFDPAFFDQFCNGPRAVRQACGVDPAGASQVLHDLPLTGIRRFHFFTFSLISTRRWTAAPSFLLQVSEPLDGTVDERRNQQVEPHGKSPCRAGELAVDSS